MPKVRIQPGTRDQNDILQEIAGLLNANADRYLPCVDTINPQTVESLIRLLSASLRTDDKETATEKVKHWINSESIDFSPTLRRENTQESLSALNASRRPALLAILRNLTPEQRKSIISAVHDLESEE